MFKIKETLSGLLVLIVGIFFKLQAGSYDLGTAEFMGPGFFPNFISIWLIIIGSIMTIKSIKWK